MKIDSICKIPKVVIYTNEITKEISDLVSRLSNDASKSMLSFNNGEIFIINPDDVISIYIENQKILACCTNGIYNLKKRLYELEKDPPSSTFVRISNSEIVNTSEKHPLLIPTQLLMVGVISFEFIQLPILHEFEKSTIVKETVIHFIISSVFFFSMTSTWGAVDIKSVSFIILILDFILIYLVIWLIQYFNLKHEIKKINNKLLEK